MTTTRRIPVLRRESSPNVLVFLLVLSLVLVLIIHHSLGVRSMGSDDDDE